MLTFTLRRVGVTALLLNSFFVWGNMAQATSTPSIVINEIGAYETTDHEWLEIYNTSPEAIDITGWKFWENDTHHGLNEFQGDLVIEPGEYAVIAQKADIFVADKPEFTGTVIDGAWGTLKEAGEVVGLKNASGNFIEQFTYLAAPDFSLERKDPLLADYTSSNWQEHADSNTAGEQNSNYNETPTLILPLPEGEDAGRGEQNLDGAESSPAGAPKILPPQPGQVIINEFVSDPTDGEEEWIELYSMYDKPIDLEGWVLEEGSVAKTKLSGTFFSYTYLVAEKLKGNLNNKGDIIMLKDPDGQVIFELTYGEWDDGNIYDNAPLAKDPHAVARIKNATQRRDDANNYRVTATPTKGAANYITTPQREDPSSRSRNKTDDNKLLPVLGEGQSTTTPKTIQPISYPPLLISEFLPDPQGNDHELEFIELYNPNLEAVPLWGWQLDDADGGSRPYTIATGTIEALRYKTFYASTTRVTLNNNGDSVRLFNPLGELVDLVEYDKLDTGIAIIKDNDSIQQTSSPTPNEPNIVTKDAEIDESLDFAPATVDESAKFSAGDKIITTGIVTVPPGRLGSKILYLDGLQVYMHKADWPDIKMGDEIQVQGEISIIQSGTRIKLKGKEAIGIISPNNNIDPSQLEVIDIDEESLNNLITVSGEVVEVKKGAYWVDDDSGEIRVVVKSSTDISQEPSVGDFITITGVLDQTRSGFRLLPRSNEDIVIAEVLGEEYTEEIVKTEKTISIKKIASGVGNFFKSLWQRIFS